MRVVKSISIPEEVAIELDDLAYRARMTRSAYVVGLIRNCRLAPEQYDQARIDTKGSHFLGLPGDFIVTT